MFQDCIELRPSSLPDKSSCVETTASPISDCAKKLSDEMQREMMTPRSRRPVTMTTQEALKDSDGFKVRHRVQCADIHIAARAPIQ